MLRQPCTLGDVQQMGPKSGEDASPLPCRGPKRGRKCFVIPAFSGIVNERVQNQKRMPHPCLLGAHTRAEMLTSPLHSRGSSTKGAKTTSGYLRPGPKEGRNATSPLHSRGSSTNGTKITRGCLTLAFSGAQKRAEMLRQPCILGDPQQTGAKLAVAASPLPCQWPKKRAEMLCHPYILGDPQQRGPKSEVATSPMPCRGPKVAFWRICTREPKSALATSPLPCRGPKRGWKCNVNTAFSGIPHKGVQNEQWMPPLAFLKA